MDELRMEQSIDFNLPATCFTPLSHAPCICGAFHGTACVFSAPSNAISRNPAKKFLTMLRFKRNMGQNNKRIIRDAVDEFEAANLNRIGEAFSGIT